MVSSSQSGGQDQQWKGYTNFRFGAEVSIVDTTFARKVGCFIDKSCESESVGIGENLYMTVGCTKIEVTLIRSQVYIFDAWVGDHSGQEAILGMNFMVAAGDVSIWRTEHFTCRTK